MRIPDGAGAVLRLQVPPDGRYARYVRERVVGFTDSHVVAEADALEFVTAVSEALANAIEHACAQDPIEITCWLDADDRLLATVVDRGIGFDAGERVGEPPLPDLLAERGRGLPIMKRCTDLFDVRSAPGEGTRVVLGRFVRRGDGAPESFAS